MPKTSSSQRSACRSGSRTCRCVSIRGASVSRGGTRTKGVHTLLIYFGKMEAAEPSTSTLEPSSPPPASPKPRYLLETQRHRSPAQLSHRAHGAALREQALQQRLARQQKVEALTRHNKRRGANVRREERSIGAALEKANSAYREHARQYVSELRELPSSIKKTAAALAEARQVRANELKAVKSTEWEQRRSENIQRKANIARALHDEVKRSKMRRSVIPPEMEAEMRRLKIGPFAESSSDESQQIHDRGPQLGEQVSFQYQSECHQHHRTDHAVPSCGDFSTAAERCTDIRDYDSANPLLEA